MMKLQLLTLCLFIPSVLSQELYSCDIQNAEGETKSNPDSRGMLRGFQVNYYPYAFNDTSLFDTNEWFTNGYKTGKSLATNERIVSPNFWTAWTPPWIGPGHNNGNPYDPSHIIYHYPLIFSNVTLEFTAYLYTTEPGNYTFRIANFGAAYVFFGSESAFKCNDPFNFQQDGKYNWRLSNGNATYTVALQADKYYPLRIIYVTTFPPALFQFQVTLPNGTDGNLRHFIIDPFALDTSARTTTTLWQTTTSESFTTIGTDSVKTVVRPPLLTENARGDPLARDGQIHTTILADGELRIAEPYPWW